MNECVGEQGHDATRVFFTWRELLMVGMVLAVLAALFLPKLLGIKMLTSREKCANNLKQFGLALHNYAQANKVFPPGTISQYKPTAPGDQYDILAEAAETGPGFQGTSFLLRIVPFIEGDGEWPRWRFKESISSLIKEPNPYSISNFEFANSDYKGFYCPSRRKELRPVDRAMMLSPAWTGGGTDYGGCAGRPAAFTLNTGYNLCDASTFYDPNYFPPSFSNTTNDEEKKRCGIFGRVNKSTTFAEIRDGISNTIIIGELQRFTDVTPISRDGWVIGGPCTLFTTGAMIEMKTVGGVTNISPVDSGGKLMNNKFFGSPGSEHGGGANFGMADGSVRFLAETIDPQVFSLFGSMADGEPVMLE